MPQNTPSNISQEENDLAKTRIREYKNEATAQQGPMCTLSLLTPRRVAQRGMSHTHLNSSTPEAKFILVLEPRHRGSNLRAPESETEDL